MAREIRAISSIGGRDLRWRIRLCASFPSDARTKVNVAYADIAALAFTGRDTAAGKTFEAWVKKYWEKKAAGETNIQIEPEKLD